MDRFGRVYGGICVYLCLGGGAQFLDHEAHHFFLTFFLKLNTTGQRVIAINNSKFISQYFKILGYVFVTIIQDNYIFHIFIRKISISILL